MIVLGVCLSVFILLCKLVTWHIKYHSVNSIQQSIFSFISIYFTDHCSKGDNKQNTRNIPLMRPFQFLQFTFMQITSCN